VRWLFGVGNITGRALWARWLLTYDEDSGIETRYRYGDTSIPNLAHSSFLGP